MTSVLRTIIVDSDPESRASLRQMLSSTPSVVVGEFSHIVEALAGAPPCRPDVLIVEIPFDQARRSEGGGISALAELARALPDTAIFATGSSAPSEFVIQVIRAGAHDFLRRPVTQDELVAGLSKVARSQRRTLPERRQGRVTAVFSTKGGVGVTTIATNLASCWGCQRAGRTLLMDFDTRQSDVATFLNVRHTYSVFDAFENVARLDESFLRGLLIHHPSGLWVLPGPARMERAKLSGEQVKVGLQILRSYFDQVVLDLPHDLDPGTLAALESSDTILFLVNLTVSALRSGAAGIAAFRHLQLDLDKVRIVVMREGTGEDVNLKHAKETLGLPIYWKTPSDYMTVVTAINQGEPVLTAFPRSKIAKNLRQLGDQIANGQAPAVGPSSKDRASAFRLPWTTRATLGGK